MEKTRNNLNAVDGGSNSRFRTQRLLEIERKFGRKARVLVENVLGRGLKNNMIKVIVRGNV